MGWTQNPIIAIHVANLLVGLFVLLLCWHRRNLPGAYRIMGLMGALLVWVVGSAMGASVGDPDAKVQWAILEFIGITITPLAYLILAMEFNGGTFTLNWRSILLLMIPPVFFWMLVFTNGTHQLIWEELPIVRGKIQFVHGPVYPVVLAYNVTLFLLASVRMLHAVFNFPRHYWHLASILVIALMAPLVGVLIHVLGLISSGFDPTPVCLAFTGASLAAALLYTSLLDIAPVAREVLVDKMREGILVFDALNRLVDFNHSAEQIMEQELSIGDKPTRWMGPWHELSTQLEPGKGHTLELGPLPDGGWVEVRVSALTGVAERSQGHLAVIYDIGLRKRMETRLLEMASRDALTGLYNRHYFSEMLTRELSRCRRDGQQLAVILMDIDHFKAVNDTYGHAGGDFVLQSLADLILTSSRTEDCACRWGGEEFVVALPGCSLQAAQEKAEEWRSAFCQKPMQWTGNSIRTSISLGIAMYPEHGCDEDALVKASDAALYLSKSQGRNRITTATGSESLAIHS